MSRSAREGGARLWKTFILFSVISWSVASESWSREVTGQNNEWVPLQSSAPTKRQAAARVLNLPSPFQPNFYQNDNYQDYVSQEASRQLFLQPAPQQGFINQQNAINPPIQLTLRGRFNPAAFVPREELNEFDFRQSIQEQFQQQQPVVPQSINNQFYSRVNNENSFPQVQAQSTVKPQAPKYVDGYKVENVSGEYLGTKKLDSSIPSLRDKVEENSVPPSQQVMSDRSSPAYIQPTTPTSTTVEKEEVQLLYVPLETLQNKKFDMKQFLKNSIKQNTLIDSLGSPVQINNQLYSTTTPSYSTRQQSQLHNIQQDLLQQALNTQNLQGSFQQNQFQRQGKYHQSSPSALPFTQSFPIPSITTPRSKKLKAHQPPLAVFTAQKGPSPPKLTDVLSLLKEYKSISVLDTVIPNSPDVFIGPSNLNAPEKYSRFELPYLSNIDGNRIQRKVGQLPFFVAPLSYKAPDGFAKIPFPAPHVGSVIVNPFMADPVRLSSTSSPSSSAFSFDPTTESFRNTIRESIPGERNTFNFFPSPTPDVVNSQRTTLSGFKNPFGLEQFNQYRPQQSTRRPEPTIISSAAPAQNYFSTSARPSVSYFSFPGPDISTIPTTKQPNFVHENRGHYITNAAVDNNSPFKYSTSTRDSTTQQQTSPLPPTSPKYETQNPYNINQAFALKNPYEPSDFRTSIRGNEIRHYNNNNNNNNFRQPAAGLSDSHLFNTFSQPEQKYQFPNQQKVNTGAASISDYSPRPYLVDSFPKAITETKAPKLQTIAPEREESFRTREKESFSPEFYNQYTSPSADDDVPEVTEESEYETEAPTTYEIPTPTTTTTTTTTTAAPTTTRPSVVKTSRRPLVRGRPRYTTPKPDDSETTVRPSTTRRTPIRERKPNTFRTRLESSRTTTTTSTTTDSTIDSMNSFESAKNRGSPKLSMRPQLARNKPQEIESKTTTESPTERPTQAGRNTRVRSRGRTHFKSSDGNDFVPKKKAKTEEDNIAYQRDVLHQNYPVTISERRTTLEVRTTTAMPRSLSSDRENIKIYETTSNTQRSYSLHDSTPESQFAFQNEPVFQGEQQRFITQPELYVEINGKNPSTPNIQLSPEQDRTTERFRLSSSSKYEENTQAQIAEENTEAVSDATIVDITKEERQSTLAPSTIPYTPEVQVEDEPAPKFRSKLRPRPKLLPSLNVAKKTDDEYQSIYSDSFVTSKKVEGTTESSYAVSKKAQHINPSTYRPLFTNRRTTMKIEEIEEELKSKRVQVRPDSRSTTFKYPVYIPESTSAIPSEASESFTPTTKKTHFIRRRPVRPTSTAAPIETTTESQPASARPTNKRIRVRSRVRARPSTTEKIETSRQVEEEETSQTFSSPDVIPTRRTVPSKYVRNRQPTQKYFRKPIPQSDRNLQSTTENEDDQDTFDSINRPKFVDFNSVSSTPEFIQFSPDNENSESQWSPKLSYNSFRPVYNPNVITDTLKSDSFEYGTKLNSEEPEIITAGSPYEDVLISVTPASNLLNKSPSSTLRSSRVENDEKVPETTSTFESVLEEVMRNLEEQDEDEYSKDYVTVMKHEGGEIGEIPPETTSHTDYAKELTQMTTESDIRKITSAFVPPTAPTSFAENRSFNTVPEEIKETTTVRKPRRRGFWRKVRPVNKDLFDTAESQFYKNSANDLVREDKPKKNLDQVKQRTTEKPIEKIIPTTTPQPKVEVTEPTTEDNIENVPTIPPTILSVAENTEEFNSYDNTDPETSAPDLIAMEVNNQEVNLLVSGEPEVYKEQTTEPETKTEYLMSPTVEPVPIENEITTVQADDIKSSIVQFMSNLLSPVSRETNKTVTTQSTDDVVVTTQIPESEPNEVSTDKPTDEPAPETQSFSEAMEKILAEVENFKEDDARSTAETKVEDQNQTEKEKIAVETTTMGFKFLDPSLIIGTSMSTEVSHETEICFRGKCVKTKNIDQNINSNP